MSEGIHYMTQDILSVSLYRLSNEYLFQESKDLWKGYIVEVVYCALYATPRTITMQTSYNAQITLTC